MFLKQYRKRSWTTIRAIDPYGRLIGTHMDEIPTFHFDPDPLYRETVFKMGWDPEKDVPPSIKAANTIAKQSKDWLKSQKNR